MVKLGGFLISVFLIIIILPQISEESVGLKRSSRFGSQRFVEILTFICILLYFGIAWQLNIINN